MLPAFDVVFIDGGHSYPVVTSDLRVFMPMVAVGGLLVVDDAGDDLNFKAEYKGWPEVSRAVRDVLDPDPQFVELFASNSMRVWRRVITPEG